MKECVGWTSSRLTIRLLNLKRPQLNRVVQVLTGHCNLQRSKKTTGRAESSLCPKCSLENETPNHHGSNCKLYQDIRVKQYLNCRRDASPHRELASLHQDLASPHRYLGVPSSRFERWMIRQKRPNSSPNFGEKTLQVSVKTFYFGVYSISATE